MLAPVGVLSPPITPTPPAPASPWPGWRSPGHRHGSRLVPASPLCGLTPPPPRCLVSLARHPSGPLAEVRPEPGALCIRSRPGASCPVAPRVGCTWRHQAGCCILPPRAGLSNINGEAWGRVLTLPCGSCGTQRHPLPYSIHKSKMNLIKEPVCRYIRVHSAFRTGPLIPWGSGMVGDGVLVSPGSWEDGGSVGTEWQLRACLGAPLVSQVDTRHSTTDLGERVLGIWNSLVTVT